MRIATAGGLRSTRSTGSSPRTGRGSGSGTSGTPVNDAGGSPTLVRWPDGRASRDQTSARARARRRCRGRFRRVIEDLPAIVYLESVTREDNGIGRMLYVSPQVEEILGFPPAGVDRRPLAWARQFHPDDRMRSARSTKRIESTGGPFQAEYRMYTRDGDIRWFRDEATSIRGRGREPRATGRGSCTTSPRSARREERARESEDRYRTLVEQIPAIVYREEVTGDGLKVVYINARVQELIGISPGGMGARPGRLARRRSTRTTASASTEEDRRTELTGEPFLAEYRMRARDGRVVWFRDQAVMMRGPDGEPAYWQGVMIDITAAARRRRASWRRPRRATARWSSRSPRSPTSTRSNDGPTVYVSPQTAIDPRLRAARTWYADKDLLDEARASRTIAR